MLARHSLLTIQRAMYQRLRTSAADYFGHLGPELKRYFLDYQREFQRFGRVSSKQELLTSLLRAQIALCGDYHTLEQAQRTVIRLLREALPELRKRGRPLILALEMLPHRATSLAARYLAGRLGEERFLKAIGFSTTWGFEWENYRKLFQFCAAEGVRCVGLNGPDPRGRSGLRVRDRFASRVIAQLTEAEPEALVFVLVGDLHLARNHLPREVERAVAERGMRRRTVTIHQNHEELYWKLVERGLEHKADVIRLRRGVYCVMNTPPWIKLQSLVRWGEVQAGAKVDYLDPFCDLDLDEDFHDLLGHLHRFLGLEEPPDTDFHILGPRDLLQVARLGREHGFSASDRKLLLACLGAFPSQYIPEGKTVFLGDFGLNQMAHQAALFLHAKLADFGRRFTDPGRDFYTFVWVEALGFLGSKAINPKRKCLEPVDLKELAGSRDPERHSARWVVRHLEREPRFPRLPRGGHSVDRIVFYYRAAKRLGHLLGNGIFLAAMDNQVSREQIRGLFENPFPPNQARDLYRTWIRRLDRGGYRRVARRQSL